MKNSISVCLPNNFQFWTCQSLLSLTSQLFWCTHANALTLRMATCDLPVYKYIHLHCPILIRAIAYEISSIILQFMMSTLWNFVYRFSWMTTQRTFKSSGYMKVWQSFRFKLNNVGKLNRTANTYKPFCLCTLLDTKFLLY